MFLHHQEEPVPQGRVLSISCRLVIVRKEEAVDSQPVKEFCRSLGLTAVGIAPNHLPEPERQPDICPLAAGKGPERYDLTGVLPGCQAAVVVLFPYYQEPVNGANLSLYCQFPDYHGIIRQYLEKITAWLGQNWPESRQTTIVDTSVLAERQLAIEAGLGFEGDNGCLINGTWGSWCFIGAVLTTLPLDPDAPNTGECLHCGACARACPGNCFSSGQYDYRTCKSYLTQKKGQLPPEEITILRKTSLVFGCDECQRCCPHNARMPVTPILEFREKRQARLTARELEPLTNRQFKEQYGERAFAWRGKKLLLRNLALLANQQLKNDL